MAPLIPQVIHGERRSGRRYQVELELRYSLLGNGGQDGWGKAHNMSKGGILFEADSILPVGGQAELVIPWPFRLQQVCSLELIVVGQISRSGERMVLETASYQFRTSGARSFLPVVETGRRLLATA